MRIPLRGAGILPAAAFLAASTALSSAAFAASTGTACSALSGNFPNGDTVALSQALGFTGPGTGTPLVLGIQAQDIPANALVPGQPSPALCAVGLVIASNGNPAQSQVTVDVLMPAAANWNGKFLGTGNGGFAGSVAVSTLGLGLIPSYAVTGHTYVVANTDLGTGNLFKCNSLFCGSKEGVADYPNQTPGGLYGDAAALTDFGSGATHLMTLAAKSLINTYYSADPSYSYFHGCSTGGQQALMEAQRFPADYDGILAGSPAYDRTHLHVASASLYETTHAAPDYYLTNEALGLAHAGVLASCAGTDGGLPTDDFLMKPAQCSFDATALQCTGAATDVPCTDPAGTSCTCLTPHQAISMNAAWSGAHDSAGRVLYPGYERGAEEPANNLGLPTQQALGEPAFDSLDYWAFGANFDWKTLFDDTETPQPELASMIKALDTTPVGTSGDTMASTLNANSADLSAFFGRGGKLIMYAGYEDPLIPTASSIDYYNALYRNPNTKAAGPLGDNARLFLAPGMWHCNGGPGANAFGNLSPQLPPLPTIYTFDIMAALTAWREFSVVPSQVTATKYVNDDSSQGIAFQRPLCAYPMSAVYTKTKQDPKQASSWSCRASAPVLNQGFAGKYGPK